MDAAPLTRDVFEHIEARRGDEGAARSACLQRTPAGVPRWEERPVTKFERKGIAAGRAITDFAYRRVT